MKKAILILLVNLLTITNSYSQSFFEICENTTTNGTIIDYQYYNDTLYATGFFDLICDESVGYLAKWENNEWKPSAINITDPGHALSLIDDKLYIAKYEESIDSNWVYVYDNSNLDKLGEGVYLSTASGFSELPNIYDIIEFDGKVVACGEFDRVGQQEISGIMQWNGTNWESLGSGLSDNIQNTAPVMFPHQMLVHDSELYVVGNFRNAGNEEVNGIAKWNGTSWMPMGEGFNNTVYSITVYNDELIVGGSFTESGGTTLNRIAKWNGTAWTALDFGFIENSMNDFIFVHTLKVIDEVLYIGGGLKKIIYSDSSTEICNGIVGVSENTINTFGEGVPGFDIEAIIKTTDEKILIGGGVFGNGYTGVLDISSNNEEVQVKDEILLYPNPAKNEINVIGIRDGEIRIVDRIGKVVLQEKIINSKIDISSLPTGVYFVQMISGEKITTKKIVK